MQPEMERDGFKLYIEQDPYVFNPRKDFDHIGTLYVPHMCRHLRGDKSARNDLTPSDLIKWLTQERAFYAPVGAYIHSGITVWMGDMQCTKTTSGWDSGTIGIIYCMREDARTNWPKARGAKLAKHVEECLSGEIAELDQYLTGDVWRYSIQDPDGNVLDSCSGFYGLASVKTEARSQFEYWYSRETEAIADYLGRM